MRGASVRWAREEKCMFMRWIKIFSSTKKKVLLLEGRVVAPFAPDEAPPVPQGNQID